MEPTYVNFLSIKHVEELFELSSIDERLCLLYAFINGKLLFYLRLVSIGILSNHLLSYVDSNSKQKNIIQLQLTNLWAIIPNNSSKNTFENFPINSNLPHVAFVLLHQSGNFIESLRHFVKHSLIGRHLLKTFCLAVPPSSRSHIAHWISTN